MEYQVKVVLRFIEMMRHRKARLKSDNDLAIVDLLHRVKVARKDDDTLLQFSPRYSSQPNGRAE